MGRGARKRVPLLISRTTLIRPVPTGQYQLVGFAPLGDHAALERVLARADSDDRLEDLTARDPRGVGVRGGYPQIVRGPEDKKRVLRFLQVAYARSAAARVVVDRIAAETWGHWIKLEAPDALKQRLEEVFKFPTARQGDRPIWWWFERADRLASRDGRALLFFNLVDATGQSKEKPRRVRGIRNLQVIREAQIAGKLYDTDPASPTFGQVRAWKVWVNVGAYGDTQARGLIAVEQEIHADRCLAFIPDPDEDDPCDGVSIIFPLLNIIEYGENIAWASAEAYFQEAQPLLAVYRDPDVPLDPDGKEEIKKAVAKLQQNALQRVFLHGAKVEVVGGSAQLADPTPHWDIATDLLAMALGYPKRWLFGDAAGELAASKEDSRRAETRLKNRKEQYAGPLLYAFLARLIEWEVELWPLPPKLPVDFTWNPNSQPSPDERATIAQAEMITRTGYRRARLPLPKDQEYEPGEWPEGTEDFPEPQPFGAGAFGRGAPPDEEEAEGDEAPPVPVEVSDVAKRLQARLDAALLKAKRELVQLLAARADALDDDAASLLGRVRLEEELARAITEALEEATYEGAVGTFRDLGEDRVFRYLDDTSIREFKTIGQDLAEGMRERLAERVRRDIAEALAREKPASLRELTRHLEEAFLAGRSDAQRIARTETMRGFNTGTVEALRALGVQSLEFVAFPDADNGDPLGPCQQRNGKIFAVTDLANKPPIHPNCRCQLVAAAPRADGLQVYGQTLGEHVLLRARRAQAVAA